MKKLKQFRKLSTAISIGIMAGISANALADKQAAEKWVSAEFQPSTLTKTEQLTEMEWFINAAKPFKGMDIKVLSI